MHDQGRLSLNGANHEHEIEKGPEQVVTNNPPMEGWFGRDVGILNCTSSAQRPNLARFDWNGQMTAAVGRTQPEEGKKSYAATTIGLAAHTARSCALLNA